MPPNPPQPQPPLPSPLPLQVMCCNLLQQFIAQQAKSSDSDSNPLPAPPAIPINYPIASIIVRSPARQSDISFHGNRRAFPNKQLKVHLEQTKGKENSARKCCLLLSLIEQPADECQPSFTVKCAIVPRCIVVARHKSFCVNSLHHNARPRCK